MINLPCWHLSAWKGAKFSTILLLLSLLFVAGSASAEQPPRLTLAAERGSVPAGEPLRLVQSGEYSLSSGVGEGLAVSPDGRWLFGLSFESMLVWQIDSAGAVLTPANPPMYEHPSLSGGGLAVSPNGRFVFASGASNNALSVWRLNSEAGTLTMTADYREGGQDAAENTITGIAGVFDVVPNADGSLLFVTSAAADRGALSVWRVDNSSGTLVETEVYESTAGENSLGLAAAAGAALSPDGSLLFVGTFASGGILDERDGLSVWRVNAEEGTPTVTHLMTHRDDQRLRRPRYVAVSPSGLLLVSSQISGSAVDPLSIWRAGDTGAIMSLGSFDDTFFGSDPGAVGATAEVVISAGLFNNALFLFRIDEDGDGLSFVDRYDNNENAFTYRNGNPAISAQLQIGVTASPAGGLVFISGFRGPVTAWRVEGIPRVPAGQEVRVTVNADPAPMAALAVTVEARQGSRVVTAPATFEPQEATAQAVFAGGALGPGEWTFAALSASTADVSAARGTVRINSPDVRLENLSGRVREAESLEIKVIASASLPEDVMVTVRGRRGSATIAETGLLSTGQTSLSVTFGSIPEEGVWTFSAVPRLPLVTAADDTDIEVSIRPPLPQLTLDPAAQDFALDSDVDISVSATGALDSDVTVTVSADSGSTSDSLFVMLLRGDGTSPPAAVLASFPAGTLDEGTYTIMAGASVDDVAADAMMTTIRVRRAVLRLSLQIDEDTLLPRSIFLSEEEVTFLIEPDIVPGISAAVTPRAVRADLTTAEGMPITLSADADTAVNAVFPADTLAAGLWTVTASGAPDIFDSGELSVEVLAQPVNASLSAEQIRLRVGAPFQLTLSLERTFQNDFAVQLRTVPDQSASALSMVLTIPSGQMTGSAMFSLPAAGTYLFESSSSILNLPPLEITAVTPMLELSVPPSVSAGSTVLATVTANLPLPSDITVEVLARQYRAERQAQVVLRSGSSAGDAVFQAEDGNALGPGPWLLRIESVTSEFPVSHNLQTAISVDAAPLTLAAMQVGSAVQVLVATAFQAASTATITVTASQGDTRYHRTAVLEPLAMEVRANFEEDLLSAGAWTFRVSEILPVGIFDATAAQAELLVRVVPSLRFEPVSTEVPAGLSVPVLVRADNAPGRAITLEITATAAGEMTGTVSVSLEAESTEAELGLTLPAAGIWTLTMTADPADAVQGEENARATVTVTAPVLSLRPAASRYLPNTDVTLNAEASAELAAEAIIMVQAARVDGQSSSVSPVPITLGPGAQNTSVIFVGGLPSLGDWRFTAQSASNAVDVTEARATVTVTAPVLSLRPAASRYLPNTDVTLNAEASAELAAEAIIMVQAARVDGQPSSVSPVSITLGPGAQNTSVIFVGGLPSLGDWRFTAQSASNAVDVTEASATLTVGNPMLRLMPSEPRYGPLDDVVINVGADTAPDTEVTVTVQAARVDGQPSSVSSMSVTLGPTTQSSLVTFSGLLLAPGEWLFTAQPSSDTVDAAGATASATVEEATLRLERVEEQYSTPPVEILVRTNFPLNRDESITITAENPEFSLMRSTSIVLTAVGVTTMTVTVTTTLTVNLTSLLSDTEGALQPGRWVLSTEPWTFTGLGEDQEVDPSPPITVFIGFPRLSLALPAGTTAATITSAGSTLGVTVFADFPPRVDAEVTVQAVRAISATATAFAYTATTAVAINAGEREWMALFGGDNALAPGQWIFTITEVQPSIATSSSSQELRRIIGPSSLSLSAAEFVLGQDVVISMNTDVSLRTELRITVTATLEGSLNPAISRSVVLQPDALSVELTFAADVLSAGRWSFQAQADPLFLVTDQGVQLPLVDVTTASLVLDLMPALVLEPPPPLVGAGQDVIIGVQASAPLSEAATVMLMAEQQFGGQTLRRMASAELAVSGTATTAVFTGINGLLSGTWTLTATVVPMTAAAAPPPAMVTVGIPRLRLLRLGPDSVAAGTAVRVRVTADAMPLSGEFRVTASRPDRPNVEIAGALAPPNLSAEVGFPALSPGEWFLTVAAELLSTGGAVDAVVVGPITLILAAERERVPASEPVALTLSGPVSPGTDVAVFVIGRRTDISPQQAIALGTTVTVTLSADAARLDFNYQLTPGQWAITAQPQNSEVASASEALNVVVQKPLLRLQPVRYEIEAGSPLRVRVISEVALSEALSVTVLARQHGEERTAEAVLESRSETADFYAEAEGEALFSAQDGNALGPGSWILRVVKTNPTDLVDSADARAAVTVSASLMELAAEQRGSMVEVRVSAEAMPTRPVTIMVTARRAPDLSEQYTRSALLEASALAVQVIFEPDLLSAGLWIFSVTELSPTGILDAASATAELQVLPFLRLLEPQGIPADGSAEVTVLASSLLERAADITVTALRGEREVAASVRMESGQSSATVQFDAGVLSAGEWLLSISVPPAAADSVQVSAESVTLVVAAPVVSFEPAMIQVPNGRPATVTVTSAGAPGQEVVLRITATAVDGATRAVTVSLAAEAMSAEGQLPLPSAGIWVLTMTADPDTAVQGEELARGTVEVTVPAVRPVIRLAWSRRVYLSDQTPTLRITVTNADLGVPADLTLTPVPHPNSPAAVPLPPAENFPIEIGAGESVEWPRPGLPTGLLRFMATLNPDVATLVPAVLDLRVRDAGARIPVDLSVVPPEVFQGEAVMVRAAIPEITGVGLDLRLSVTAPNGEQTPLEILIPEGATSTLINYVLDLPGRFVFHVPGDEGVTEAITVSAFATVPELSLSVPAGPQEPVPAGSTVGVVVSATRSPPADLSVAVQATRITTDVFMEVTRAVTVMMSAEEEEVTALFGGENVLSPGRWSFAIAAIMPEGMAAASTGQVQLTVGASALSLSAMSEAVPQALPVRIDINTEVALEELVEIEVRATRQGGLEPVMVLVRTILLQPDALSAELVFAADVLALGRWRFEVIEFTPRFLLSPEEPLLDITAASLELDLRATLTLEPPSAAVEMGQDVAIGVRSSRALSEDVTVILMAERLFNGTTLGRTVTADLAAASMATTAVFSGSNALLPGFWTLTARLMPATAAIAPSPAAVTVQAPRLRLERLGPPLVAVDTPVAVRVTANAMPEVDGFSVTARQPGRPDVVLEGMLGEDLSAQLEFPSLSSGEWFLAATAEVPGALLDGSAIDIVTVEPIALSLVPRQSAVQATEQAVLVLNSARPLGVDVDVLVTAERVQISGITRQVTRMVSIDGDEVSTEIVYSPGELTPGEWIFSVQASTATRMVADLSATTTLRVNAALLSIAAAQARFAATGSVALGMTATARPGQDVRVTARATFNSQTVSSALAVFAAEQTTAEAAFSVGELFPGDWTFIVSSTDPSGLLDGTAAVATATVVMPVLSLELTQFNFLVTEPAEIPVSLNIAPGIPLLVTVVATQSGANTVTADLRLGAAEREGIVIFPVGSLTAGEWTLVSNAPFVVASSSTVVQLLETAIPATALEIEGTDSVQAGEAVTLAVTLAEAVPVSLSLQVIARDPDGETRTPVDILVATGQTSGSASYTLESRPGIWQFSLLTQGSISVSGDGLATSATVVPPVLSLQTGASPVPLGTTVEVTLRVSALTYLELAVQVQARMTVPAAMTRTVSVVLGPTSPSVSVEFAGENMLSRGEWVISIMDASPSTAVRLSAAGVTVEVGASLLSLAPVSRDVVVVVGSPVEIEVLSTAPPGGAVGVTVTARQPNRESEELTVMLGASERSVLAVFAGEQRLLTGEWSFAITAVTPPLAADFSDQAVSITVNPPVLTLLPPALPAEPGSEVEVGIGASVPPGEDVVLRVIATRMVGQRLLTREAEAMLGASAQSASAVFRAGENGLLPGIWTLTATANLPLPVSVQTATVNVLIPQITLDILGNSPRVQAGTRVELEVTASAAPAVPIAVTVRGTQSEREDQLALPVMLQAGTLTQVAEFPSLPPGEWSFSVTAVDIDPPGELMPTDGPAPVVTVNAITLVLETDAVVPFSSAAIVRVRASEGVAPDVELNVAVTANPLSGEALPQSITLSLTANSTSAFGEFPARTLAPGFWEISGAVEEGLESVAFVAAPGPTLRVEPALALSAEQAGSRVNVLIAAEAPPHTAVTATVLATFASDSSRTETVSVTLNEGEAEAVFSAAAGNALDLGLWIFTVVATPAEVVSVETARAELTVLPALSLRLAGADRVPAGSEVQVEVGVTHALPSDIEVLVTARQERLESVTRAVSLQNGLTAATENAIFEAGALAPGSWTFTAETTPVGLVNARGVQADVLVGMPLVFLDVLGSSVISPTGTIIVELSIVPAQDSVVSVVLSLESADGRSASAPASRMLLLQPGEPTRTEVSATELGVGFWRFRTEGPDDLDYSNAEALVLVTTQRISVSLSVAPQQDVFPGDQVILSATAGFEGELGVELVLEISVTDPRGRTLDAPLTIVIPALNIGSVSFVPYAEEGTWMLTVTGGDAEIGDSAPLEVRGLSSLDFSEPPNEVNADDLTLILRYLRLCPGGDTQPAGCSAQNFEGLDLTAGLADSSFRLSDLAGLRLPDITGNGPGDIRSIVLLLAALQAVGEDLLIPITDTAEGMQARAARLRIIQRLLGRE